MASRLPRPPPLPPKNSKTDSDTVSNLYDTFILSENVEQVISVFNQICSLLQIKQPLSLEQFLQRLKTKLAIKCPKSKRLVDDLFQVAKQKGCIETSKTMNEEGYVTTPSTNCCANRKILIVGAGPAGLRMAIESRFLGAEIVIVDYRTNFTRYNITRLWQQAVDDLHFLKPKHFCKDFLTGSYHTISIRRLQFLLLKYALCLGVQCHFGFKYEELIEPTEANGWRAKFTRSESKLENFEFDVLVDATGKRNSVYKIDNFIQPKESKKINRNMIAVAANFVDCNCCFDMQSHGNDIKILRNKGFNIEVIVHFSRETHYFILIIKDSSELTKHNIIYKDFKGLSTKKLLKTDNIDQEALKKYARNIANEFHSIKCSNKSKAQKSFQKFHLNENGEDDVGIFYFVASDSAFNSSRIIERKGKMLFMSLIGDALITPFWPEGTGVVKGFLGALDLCWVLNLWSSNEKKITPLQLLKEKELLYGQLRYMDKKPKQFRPSLDPANRYNKFESVKKSFEQIADLYDTDVDLFENVALYEATPNIYHEDINLGKTIVLDQYNNFLRGSTIKPLSDCCTCWRDGKALLTLIKLWSPDFPSLDSVNDDNILNNTMALNVIAVKCGIPPPFSASKMAVLTEDDEEVMLNYLYNILQLLSKPNDYGDNGCIKRKQFTVDVKLSSIQPLRKKITQGEDENANVVKDSKSDQKDQSVKKKILKCSAMPSVNIAEGNVKTETTLKKQDLVPPAEPLKPRQSKLKALQTISSATSKQPKQKQVSEKPYTLKATEAAPPISKATKLSFSKLTPALVSKSAITHEPTPATIKTSTNVKRDLLRQASAPVNAAKPTTTEFSALQKKLENILEDSFEYDSEITVSETDFSDYDYDDIYSTPAKASMRNWKRRGSFPNIHVSGTSGKYCAVCDKLVYQAVQVRISAMEIVHRMCFRCCECDKKLINQPFQWYSHEGCFYCLEHEPPLESDEEEVVEYQYEELVQLEKEMSGRSTPKANLKLILKDAEIEIEGKDLTVRLTETSEVDRYVESQHQRSSFARNPSRRSRFALQRAKSSTQLDKVANKSKEICHSCKLFLRPSNAIVAADHAFHINCLKCSKCFLTLTKENYYYNKSSDEFFCHAHRVKTGERIVEKILKPMTPKFPFKLALTPKTPFNRFAGYFKK